MEAKRHDIHGQWVTEDAKDIGVFLEKNYYTFSFTAKKNM